VSHCAQGVLRGWGAIATHFRECLLAAATVNVAPVLVIECYAGVLQEEIRTELQTHFPSALWIDSRAAFRPASEIDSLTAPDLGGDDPVFGHLSRLQLGDFLCEEVLATFRARIAAARCPVVVIGPGASLIASHATWLVYANLPRWEAQQRHRRGETANLGVDNRAAKASLKYKRAFFVDWRVCDRLKRSTIERWDFLLDTSVPGDPKLVPGENYRRALAHCVARPFRVVPFFDPGPWGGQWMKDTLGLDRPEPNLAWAFDCVPEENSLLLRFGEVRVEVPAIDLVFAEPAALLGEPVHGRFGAEFPIRFDMLDTMGGGNLSLQVHPLTEYMRARFGLHYTQDESYYILDAEPEAVVYLGRRRNTELEAMFAALEAAQRGGQAFDDERFVARFRARRHDHFLIPAGTLHGSGRNCMVLEISATPYLFTFKLWDWNRPGLDGKPRPIHLEHGRANLLWERDEDYARERLINQISEVARGEGWREERTGLHEAEFIETRRHWFSAAVAHHTGGERFGSVNVLNLVQGEQAVVESPDEAFQPFPVHYAETFIVPAAVGPYRIRPPGRSQDRDLATIKAFVRHRA
jgi:mannose-6-phosphate isomerase class I